MSGIPREFRKQQLAGVNMEKKTIEYDTGGCGEAKRPFKFYELPPAVEVVVKDGPGFSSLGKQLPPVHLLLRYPSK